MALSDQTIGVALDGDGNFAIQVGPSGYTFSGETFREIDLGRSYVDALFLIQLYLQLAALATDLTDAAATAAAANGMTVRLTS